jgi:hypothetical protein
MKLEESNSARDTLRRLEEELINQMNTPWSSLRVSVIDYHTLKSEIYNGRAPEV